MDLLAAVRGPATSALLDAVDVGEGWQCVDVGCGGGHVTLELGRRVGPAGSVLGIDLDDALLEVARQEAAAQGLRNVTFRKSTAEDLEEIGLDLAYARLVLMHCADPTDVAGRMVGAVRSGGVVAIEDAQFSGCFTYPSCPAYDRWVDWYQETVRRNGGDANVGPRLPTLLQSVGLAILGVRVVQDAFLDGPKKQLQQMSMAKQKASVVAAGVATVDEYDAAHTEVRAFAADPATLIAGPRIIQAWGQRQ
jgi:SAM-dependent methyltransferase